MKKNLFIGMLAMAGMLFATSCTQDELLDKPSADDFVNATFSISTPEGIATRAAENVGMGTTVNYVACAVYDSKGEEMTELRQYKEIKGKEAEYSIRLVKGQEYRVVFFAYFGEADRTCKYYDLTDMKNIAILEAHSNREGRDAFTAYFDVEAGVEAVEEEVTLRRPFAQLNLGAVAEDVEAARMAGVVVTRSQITVSNVYTAFDAYNNDVVDGKIGEVKFDMHDIPNQDLSVDMDNDSSTPDETFEYLALNYLLVGAEGTEKELTTVTFEWETKDGKTNSPATVFNNIPVQRNYRTNIVGCLLTNPADFNIIIDEEFNTPDYIVDAPWDGTTVTKPETDTDGAYIVKTAAEWVWLANNTSFNEGNSIKHIKLANSLDFGGAEIGAITIVGTFDGQGNSIRNAVITDNDSYPNNDTSGAGLFGDRTGGTIKNLDLYNIVANINTASDGWVGAVISAAQNDQQHLSLENVHVYSSDLKGVMSVGGIAGNVMGSVTLNLTNCSVNDTKVSNNLVEDKTENGHVAGLVGRVTGTLKIGENVSLKNVDVTGYYSNKRTEGSIDAVAARNLKDNLGSITGTATTDNVTVNKIPTTSDAGNATIASASGMFAFANSVNAGGNKYSGKTVTLTADIDLENQDWIPVGQTGGYYAKTYFIGTFNGNNKTIKNLNVTHWEAGNNEGKNYASGLFGFIDKGAENVVVVKNLTIDGATIKGHHWVGTIAGYLTGEVSGCKVINAAVECSHANNDACGDKAGAVIGYINGTLGTVTNCHAENSTVKAGRDAGKVVGAGPKSNVIDCNATNVVVTATGDCPDEKNINNDIIGRLL